VSTFEHGRYRALRASFGMPFQFRLWDSTPGSFDSLTKLNTLTKLNITNNSLVRRLSSPVCTYMATTQIQTEPIWQQHRSKLNLYGNNTDPNHRLLLFCTRTEGVWGGRGTRRGGELEVRDALERPEGAHEQRAACLNEGRGVSD